MTQIELAMTNLRDANRKIVVDELAKLALGLENTVRKSEEDLIRDKEELNKLKSIDLNDKKALLNIFRYSPSFSVDGITYQMSDLINNM